MAALHESVLLDEYEAPLPDSGNEKRSLIDALRGASHGEFIHERLRYDVNQRDADGQTALLIACEENLPAVVLALLEAGAHVDKQRHDGYTPLLMAAESGAAECCSILCRHLADVHNALPESGAFALSIACVEGHDAVVHALLAAGAHLDQRLHDGSTALVMACRHGRASTVQLLIDADADIHLSCELGSPLYAATFEGQAACVQVLIAARAHIDETDGYGETALFTACERGEHECAAALIAAGCALELASHSGLRPLHAACYARRPECASLLLQARAEVEGTEAQVGWPALDWARKGGDPRCIDLCEREAARVSAAGCEEELAALLGVLALDHLHSRLVSEELTVKLLRSMSDLPSMLAELGIARADAARFAAALRAPATSSSQPASSQPASSQLRAPATSPTAVAPGLPRPPPPPPLPLHAPGRVLAAVYINLASRTDRRRAMEAALPAVGLGHAERFEALTSTPPSVISTCWDTTLNARFDRNCPPNTALRMSAGERGCAASHVALWRRCAASEAPLLILEDDVSFGTPEVDASCRALVRAVEGASEPPAERLVVLYLGAEATVRESAPSLRAMEWIWAARATSVSSELLEVTWAWQTHAYLLWPAAARVLLAGLPVDAPVDVYLSRHFHEGKLCGLVAWPHMAKQHDPYRGGDVEHSSLQDRARMGLSNRLAAETAAATASEITSEITSEIAAETAAGLR